MTTFGVLFAVTPHKDILFDLSSYLLYESKKGILIPTGI